MAGINFIENEQYLPKLKFRTNMKELMIHEFEAKQIEDTLRIVANILGSRKKETCADRQVCKSIEMIKRVLSEEKYK